MNLASSPITLTDVWVDDSTPRTHGASATVDRGSSLRNSLSSARVAIVGNTEMGLVFEELIRKFAESSNETAGEHFTPRDIVHLTTSLVITGQDDKLKPNSIVTIYDPTAGSGGFLSLAIPGGGPGGAPSWSFSLSPSSVGCGGAGYLVGGGISGSASHLCSQ